MLSVIIKDNGEENVVKLTYENLFKELKDMPGSELIVADSWLNSIGQVKNRYVCFVEADCLVSSGYFNSMMGLYKKNPMNRKLAVMSSSTAVKDWANKFYGYAHHTIQSGEDEGVATKNAYIKPVTIKKSSGTYPVQIAYIPGSIIRVSMLENFLKDNKIANGIENDLVYFSTELSTGFWTQGVGNGIGNMVYLTPNSTYCTTEEYVNDLGPTHPRMPQLSRMFASQAI